MPKQEPRGKTATQLLDEWFIELKTESYTIIHEWYREGGARLFVIFYNGRIFCVRIFPNTFNGELNLSIDKAHTL